MVKKILLKGFFGHKNLGDDLLLFEALKKYPSQVRLYIEWPKIANNELLYFQNIRQFTPVCGKRDLISHFYDSVVWSGGGLFPSRTFSIRDFVRLLPYRLFSKKMILNGLGIVEKPNRKWFDRFLGMIDYCSVRDEKSLEFVSKKISALNCGDLYWGADLYGGANIRTSKRLLVCLANPFSDKELENKHINLRFEKLIKQCVDCVKLFKEKGYEVNYLPFYQGSDEKFIKKVQYRLSSNDKILERGIDYNLQTIDSLFHQYDFGLCMRFHSILLSLKNSLPIVAIEYDFKSEMLMKEAGLSEYGVRFGIRKSDFFGEEIDIEGNTLCLISERLQKENDIFKQKAQIFAEKKHQQVLQNYKKIFKLINI